ncbi:Cro/CI family transcriptional regulator [Aeromonas jandaei]
MKTKDVLEYFGGPASVARALGITSQAVSQWGEVVPFGRDSQIERVTGGRLTVGEPEQQAVQHD